jgi:hypothetical protein
MDSFEIVQGKLPTPAFCGDHHSWQKRNLPYVGDLEASKELLSNGVSGSSPKLCTSCLISSAKMSTSKANGASEARC